MTKKILPLIGKLLLLLLGAFLLFIGIKAIVQNPAEVGYLNSAIYLDEAVILPENEGKLVIINGKVEMTEPAYDTEYGLTIHSPSVTRYNEVYEQVLYNSEKSEWDWRTKGTTVITGAARVGDFDIDGEILSLLTTPFYYDDFESEEMSDYSNWYVDSKIYIMDKDLVYIGTSKEASVDSSRWIREVADEYIEKYEGAKSVYYKYFDTEQEDEITLVGIQEGNRLCRSEANLSVYYDILSKEELIEQSNMFLTLGTALFGIVPGIILVILALRGLLFSKRKKKKNNRKNNKKNKQKKGWE